MFTLLTTPLQSILKRHGIKYHKYADDLQLFFFTQTSLKTEKEQLRRWRHVFKRSGSGWHIYRWLKLNDENTEMTTFTSKYHLYQYGTCNIEIGDSAISPAKCVQNLVINMDQHLSMVQQVTSVCGTCNYHLYRMSLIRQFLTTDATRSAIQALITSHLDYCNALLAGMPAAQLAQLQHIQNKAARLVSRTLRSSHITPVLKHLHWLPVDSRITYKIAVTVFKCLHDLAPSYLVDLINIHQRDSHLHQVDTFQLCQPVAKKSVWQQAFSVIVPEWGKPYQ